MEPDMYLPKIIVVGDSGTGKTSLVHACLGERFRELIPSTIGVEVNHCMFAGDEVKVWDCAGKEELGGLRDGYYIGATGAVIVMKEFREIKATPPLIRDIINVCGNIPIAFVFNHCDEPDEAREQIFLDQIETLHSHLINSSTIFFTSAKTSRNITLPFEMITLASQPP